MDFWSDKLWHPSIAQIDFFMVQVVWNKFGTCWWQYGIVTLLYTTEPFFAASFALEHVTSQPLMLCYCKYSSPAAIFCPEPVSPRNGDFVYGTPSHMPHPGSIILYMCEFGYSLVGDSMLTCHIDGNWSAPMPTCEEGSHLPACMLKFCLWFNSYGEWCVIRRETIQVLTMINRVSTLYGSLYLVP